MGEPDPQFSPHRIGFKREKKGGGGVELEKIMTGQLSGTQVETGISKDDEEKPHDYDPGDYDH